MTAFTWTIAIFGAINTLAIMVSYYLGLGLVQQTKGTRIVDALITFILMIWAIVILSGGAK